MSMSVEIDASGVLDMFERIGDAAETAGGVAQREAQRALASVSGIPVDTGRLAASPRVSVSEDEAQMVTDVPYAGYVFGGTRYVPARPPSLAYTAAELAAAVAREVFG